MPTHPPNPLRPTPSSRHRFHLLDGLRGVASILVVYWHAPDYLWLRGIHSYFLAVDFFFCLSGFVVAFAYERRLRDSLTFTRFILARLIRLYPTFLLAALIGVPVFLAAGVVPRITGVAAPVGQTLYRGLAVLIPLQLLMLPNLGFFPDARLFPVLDPAWSLFLELLANAAFAFLLRLRQASTRYLIATYSLALVCMVYWSAYHGTNVGWSSNYRSFCGGLARVALSFFSGVLVHRIYRRNPIHVASPARNIALALAITATLVFILLTPFAFMRTTIYQLCVLVIGFPALVLFGSFCRVPARANALCAFLGDISYPLYLFHFPFLTLLTLAWARNLLLPHHAVFPFVVPFMIAFTAAFAYLAQILYDIPVRNALTRRLTAATSQQLS